VLAFFWEEDKVSVDNLLYPSNWSVRSSRVDGDQWIVSVLIWNIWNSFLGQWSLLILQTEYTGFTSIALWSLTLWEKHRSSPDENPLHLVREAIRKRGSRKGLRKACSVSSLKFNKQVLHPPCDMERLGRRVLDP
jgi:hypothetical protein